MNEKIHKLIVQVAFVIALVIIMAFIRTNGAEKDVETQAQTEGAAIEAEETREKGDELVIEKGGSYTDKDRVALYIHTFNRLPDNYITKVAADELGWDSKAGNLQEIAPNKSIGGSHFGNYDDTLPIANGREYQECDIDYESGHRNAKRIIFSNDGLIFYTDDHYKTFEQLY